MNSFPFQAIVKQDLHLGLTRLDISITKPAPFEGSIIFDVNANSGILFATHDHEISRPSLCHPFQLIPAITDLLTWNYYNRSESCGATCWQYITPESNVHYSWIFQGQPNPVLFAFEANPIHGGSSNLIVVVSNVAEGHLAPNTFEVPQYCHSSLTTTATMDASTVLPLLSILAAKAGA